MSSCVSLCLLSSLLVSLSLVLNRMSRMSRIVEMGQFCKSLKLSRDREKDGKGWDNTLYKRCIIV